MEKTRIVTAVFFSNPEDETWYLGGVLLLIGKHLCFVKSRYLNRYTIVSLVAVLMLSPIIILNFSNTDQSPVAKLLSVNGVEKDNNNNPQDGINDSKDTSTVELVILVKSQSNKFPLVSAVERNLLTEFAAEKDLLPIWIPFSNTDELFEYLANYSGDLIISNMENSNLEFDDPIKYTLPWGISSLQVVVRSGLQRMNSIQDLVSRQIAVKKSSPAWSQLMLMASENPAMDILVIPEPVDIVTVLSRVSSGRYDITVLDNFSLEKAMPGFLDLEIAFNFNDAKVMTWAVRSVLGNLHLAINRFLYKNHLQLNAVQVYREDLPALQKRKLIRLITYQSPVNYYLDNGRLQGFEYELIQRFAKRNRMRVEVVIANSHGEMADMLLNGKGDIIAASLPHGSLIETDRINYTRHYSYSVPVVIGRTLDYPLVDIRDLDGRRVVLPAESPYRVSLQRIKDSGIDFDIIGVQSGQDIAAILYRVSQAEVDLTVVSSQQINSEISGHLNLKSHFALSEPVPHSWAVRSGDTKLMSALNSFIEKEFRMGFYNILLTKYIENPAPGRDRSLLSQINRLSPYDEIVHKYAEQYGFDWRLIVAQMYQESRFDPAAISYAGAEGLMQLIPETAELLGIKDLKDPDTSINGGIRYMDYLRGRFEDNLLMEERTWFTLAAYNAGYNRVKRARWLAAKMSLDKNKWFDNVEKAMYALSKPYRKNGVLVRYCRCGQTTHYIREIKTLYDNYVRLTQAVRLASNPILSEQDS